MNELAEETPSPVTRPPRRRLRRTIKATAAVLGVLLLVLVGIAAWPVDVDELDARKANPARSYGDALARFEDWAAPEDSLHVYDPCRSALHTTGHRTEVSVVLFHGLTNCPRQFQEIAQQLQDAGMNVVVLRAPGHGIANSDGSGIGSVSASHGLTGEGLVEWTSESVDIAAGLGDEVRVLGLSMGGVAAAWAAEHRDLGRAVVVSPALGLKGIPQWLDNAAANLFSRLPGIALPGPLVVDHVYPGSSTSAAAQLLLLSRVVLRDAADSPPATTDIRVLDNPVDDQVSNGLIDQVRRDWAAHGAKVAFTQFAAEPPLPHDVVDAGQPTGRTDLVWPVLIEQVS